MIPRNIFTAIVKLSIITHIKLTYIINKSGLNWKTVELEGKSTLERKSTRI